MAEGLRAPFPWFGGKREPAPMIWDLLGDVSHYVEPFAGSIAVLLARESWGRDRVETVNDVDGMIVNMWRAIKYSPDRVAEECDVPVMEVELHARLARLQQHRTDDFVAWLEGDPEHHDPVLAADWLYVVSYSIGNPFDPGPWVVRDGRLVNSKGRGIGRELPALSGKGRGIGRELPALSGKGQGIGRELPALSGKGQGIGEELRRLSRRLQWVRITCGDWQRVLKPSTIGTKGGWDGVGVFLDPPYRDANTKYNTAGETDIADKVEAWCLDPPKGTRIVLAGYGEEHDRLLDHGWTKHRWKGRAVFKNTESSGREALWASPGCHIIPTLF